MGFVLVCGLFFWLAPFGLELSDEGYILYPAYQVSQGLLPYRDIASLYTPMTWYLHGALFNLFGLDLLPIRYLFSVVKAGFVVLTYLLARRLMPPGFAVLPSFILVLLDPAPRHWAPYPAYYGLLGALAALLAASRFLVTQRAGWLFAAGLACAFVFAAKPSIGLFTLLALSAFLVYNHREIGDLGFESADCRLPSFNLQSALSNLKSALSWVVLVGSVFAFALVLRRHLGVGTALFFLLPVLAAGLLHLGELRRGAPPGVLLPLLRRLALLWGGFLAATLPWLGVLSALVGLPLTFQWIFLSGVQTADAFYTPLLPPNRDTLEVIGWTLGGCLLAAGLSLTLSRRRIRLQRRALAAGVLGLAGALAMLWFRARSVGMNVAEYLATNLQGRFWRQTVEETDLVMYVPLIGFWLGCGWLLWRSARGRGVDARQLHLRLLVIFGSMFLFQLYPKASNYHVLFTVAPYLVLVVFLLSEVYAWCVRQWRPGSPSRATRLALSLCVLVFPFAFVVPAVRMKDAEVRSFVAESRMAFPSLRLSYAVSIPLDAITGYLQQRTPHGKPVFVYPASPMFYLVAQRPNPTRFSYLPSGYIDPAQQQEIIAVLGEQRVRYVIWDQDLVDRWGLLPMDRPLVDYLWTSYRPVWSSRSYVVLERVD